MKSESPVKKFFSAIAKALGIAEDEHVGEAIEVIAKGYEAATFGEKMDEQKRRRVTSEIWDVCYAEESLCSIIATTTMCRKMKARHDGAKPE